MINGRIWQVSLVVAALMAIASVAAADDTTINSGYDEENQILILNSYSEGDDCTLSTEGEHEVTYTITDEGLVEVAGLTNGEEADLEECEVLALDATGPVGQVNHGTFVSAIATLYDGPHRGCVISHFAQSDLGKDEQQLNGPQDSEELDTSQSYMVDFNTVVADCDRTTQENGETADNGEGRPEWAGEGPPEWAGEGPPEWAGQEGGPNAAAKSGSAPGRDR